MSAKCHERTHVDELNRRKAAVFVHPTIPSCCRTLMPGTSPIIAEVQQDTTRTVMSLLFSGTLTRCKDIRFIFCHAGGSVPMVASRMTQYGPKDLAERLPQGVDYELKRLYYDIAVGGNRPAIAALARHRLVVGITKPFAAITGEQADAVGLKYIERILDFAQTAFDVRQWNSAEKAEATGMFARKPHTIIVDPACGGSRRLRVAKPDRGLDTVLVHRVDGLLRRPVQPGG